MSVESALGYMICASPRSGSTLLCDMLSLTGVAGEPASYLRPASVGQYATNWRVPGQERAWGERYLEAVRHHSSGPSGCPALRIMWSDMPEVLGRLRSIDPSGRTDTARFRKLLGIGHYVHLRRDDLVAQAVSLVLAEQTGVWHRNADWSARQVVAGSEAAYDAAAIAAALEMLRVEADGWATWFASQSISPVHLTYEDLAVDPARRLAEVLEGVGRPLPPVLPMPGTARLASSVNDEWAARFRRESSH